MPCRFNRRRIWATRIMVEAAQYERNAFLTLTYAPENDPVTLVPSDMSAFVKRLRSWYSYEYDDKFRFYGVGEYGDQNEHPHFHFMLFNFPTCRYRRTQFDKRRGIVCCDVCKRVRDTWGLGHVFLGEVENDSAGYVSGYVTKKLNKDNPKLGNRHPEFARMSLRPGIGANAMFDVASTLMNYQNTLDTLSDVPGEITVGKRNLPIGRYLRRKLRTYVGRDEKAPQATLDKIKAELLPLQLAARADAVNPSFKTRLIEMGAGKRASAEARRRIFTRRRTL